MPRVARTWIVAREETQDTVRDVSRPLLDLRRHPDFSDLPVLVTDHLTWMWRMIGNEEVSWS